MDALGTIDDLMLDLIRERKLLDAKLEVLEKLRDELAKEEPSGEGDPDDEDDSDVEPAATPTPTRNGPATSHLTTRQVVAESLRDGPLGTTEIVRRSGPPTSSVSNTLAQFGPKAEPGEALFQRGAAGWSLTAKGIATLLEK